MTEKPHEFKTSEITIEEVKFKVLNVMNDVKSKNKIIDLAVFDFSKLKATVQIELKFDDFFEEFVKEAKENLFDLIIGYKTYTNTSLKIWWNTESTLVKWEGMSEIGDWENGEFIIKHGNDKL